MMSRHSDTIHPIPAYAHAPILLLIIGFLMASRIPTWSGKTVGMHIRRDLVIPVILGLVLYVALLVSFLWETLTATTLAYFVGMVFSVRAFRRRSREDREALEA